MREEPDKVMRTKNILRFLRPGVYGWRRGHEYLYIGYSRKVMVRISLHNLVGEDRLRSKDAIDFWFCNSEEEAMRLEPELIGKYSPKYNILKPSNPRLGERTFAPNGHSTEPLRCHTCGVEVKRNPRARPLFRWEKSFCCDAHRAAWHRRQKVSA